MHGSIATEVMQSLASDPAALAQVAIILAALATLAWHRYRRRGSLFGDVQGGRGEMLPVDEYSGGRSTRMPTPKKQAVVASAASDDDDDSEEEARPPPRAKAKGKGAGGTASGLGKHGGKRQGKSAGRPPR